VKDQNELQAMRKYPLKHTLQMVRFQSTTEMKDRIDVLDLDKLSTYGQDDLLQLAFVAIETPAELESEYHFLLEGLEYLLHLRRYQLYVD
jgi:hypothetical protein